MKEKDYFVHESACVDDGAEIGSGTKIWHFCHVSSGAKIGRGCTVGQNVFLAGGIKVGDFCKIQNNVSIYEGVELADYVFCGPSMVFPTVQPLGKARASARTPRSYAAIESAGIRLLRRAAW